MERRIRPVRLVRDSEKVSDHHLTMYSWTGDFVARGRTTRLMCACGWERYATGPCPALIWASHVKIHVIRQKMKRERSNGRST